MWLALAAGVAVWGGAADASPCAEAIETAGQAMGVPPALLRSIGIVESGRVNPVSRRVDAWPWTINVEGAGYFFETREAAIAAVVAARMAGRRSIDVGCMQINLVHHPAAFATLEDAFDPQLNANYAAAFLLRLFAQTRDWGNAAAAYHSQTPGVADEYRRRVVAGWSGATRYGVTQAVLAPFARLAVRSRPEPFGGYTPEFRARLVRDAADGRALRVSMGLLPPPRRGYAAGRARPIVQAGLRE